MKCEAQAASPSFTAYLRPHRVLARLLSIPGSASPRQAPRPPRRVPDWIVRDIGFDPVSGGALRHLGRDAEWRRDPCPGR